jgi:hypothetical protein
VPPVSTTNFSIPENAKYQRCCQLQTFFATLPNLVTFHNADFRLKKLVTYNDGNLLGTLFSLSCEFNNDNLFAGILKQKIIARKGIWTTHLQDFLDEFSYRYQCKNYFYDLASL